MKPAMSLRAATPADSAAIKKLLAGATLPTAGVEKHLETFLVVESGLAGNATGDRLPSEPGGLNSGLSSEPGELNCGLPTKPGNLIGVGGLEIHGRLALLRSLAVDDRHRRMGIASRICARLEEEAAERGIVRIYLLTETAESFFTKRGYSVTARTDAPAEIVATQEFTTLCPDSAVLMVRAC